MKKYLRSIFFVTWGLVTIFLVNQLSCITWFPVTERGHRVYGASNPQAARVIEKIFTELGGLRKDTSFAAGPTRQILFFDATVINLVGEGAGQLKALPADLLADMPATGPSLVVKDPQAAAELAVEWLHAAGFEAQLVPLKMSGLPGGSFAFVRSNAFDNDRWLMVFRWWAFRLGNRPESIKFP